MATPQKDTIYIDVDDEITSIVDKVRGSDHKIVALVLPKRAAVLQSIVNMKLLKRTADESKKKLVLITSEAGLLPLAGAVGLHVAKNLQTKPGIPAGPSVSDKIETIAAEESAEDETEEPLDTSRSIGELAGISAADADDDVIEVDSDAALDTAPKKGKKGAKNKKLKVPNFNKFRVRLALGVLAFVLLIVGWIMAFMVLPKAKVILKTDTSDINSNLTFTASTAAQALDEDKLILPAHNQELKKDDTEKTTATGQKNVGTKASGTMRFFNCNKDDKLSDTNRTVPAGTTVSTGGLSFVTQEAVTVQPSGYTGDTCKLDKASGSIAVTASSPGDQYNVSSRSYSVSGYSTISGDGSNMTGGTSKIVKVVSQDDVDNAKDKLNARGTTNASGELKSALKAAGYFALDDTLNTGSPVITSTPKVGEEASDVTVTSTTTYTMLGVKEDDLKKIIANDAKKQIDPSKQTVLDEGLGGAVLRVLDKKAADTKMSLQTIVVAGPELNANEIKQAVIGKKRGDGEKTLEQRPGIKDATISYSPFWVSKTPKKASKITVIFQKSNDK